MRFNLDILAKGSFQTTADGMRIFFPNGFASKGYLIDSEELYQRLFAQQKRWAIGIMLLISVLMAAHLDWKTILPAFIAVNLLKQAAVRRITRNMQVSDVRFSVWSFVGDHLRLPAMSRTMLYLLAVLGTLACLIGIADTFVTPELWCDTLFVAGVGGIVMYLSIRDLARGLKSGGEGPSTS